MKQGYPVIIHTYFPLKNALNCCIFVYHNNIQQNCFNTLKDDFQKWLDHFALCHSCQLAYAPTSNADSTCGVRQPPKYITVLYNAHINDYINVHCFLHVIKPVPNRFRVVKLVVPVRLVQSQSCIYRFVSALISHILCTILYLC